MCCIESWNETNFVSAPEPSAGDTNGQDGSDGNSGTKATAVGSRPASKSVRSEDKDTGGEHKDTSSAAGSGGADGEKRAKASTAEREMRYLDNKLFKAEMLCNHNARQAEKAGTCTYNIYYIYMYVYIHITDI